MADRCECQVQGSFFSKACIMLTYHFASVESSVIILSYNFHRFHLYTLSLWSRDLKQNDWHLIIIKTSNCTGEKYCHLRTFRFINCIISNVYLKFFIKLIVAEQQQLGLKSIYQRVPIAMCTPCKLHAGVSS